MRYVKVTALVLFFFLGMLFFVQNTEILTKSISIQFSVFALHWSSAPIPIYLYILVAFVIGAIVSTVYFAWDKLRMSKELKQTKRRLKSLEQGQNISASPVPAQEGIPETGSEDPTPPQPVSH